MAETELTLPPEIALSDARADQAFRVVGDTAYLWFEPRSEVLLVTFDNLATLDHPYPRLPWLHRQAGELGHSILGVQSHAKDWFRQETAPAMIRALVEQGFFRNFERVVFTGASMGGFGALNFAPLVQGATTLAFSPQSTMSKVICPFERRFTWAVNNSNWTVPRFLDAAAAIPYQPAVSILYDPFVREDKLHAARLSAPHVQAVKLNHATHEAVRVVIKSGALNAMLEEFILTGRIGPDFWDHLRERRKVRKWGRSFMDNLVKSNHPKLTIQAADAMLRDGNYFFALQAKKAILEKHPELAD